MTLNFDKRTELEDYPCFPVGIWRVVAVVKTKRTEMAFEGKDIRMSPNGLFLRHGNGTQSPENRRLSFLPWGKIEGAYQVEGSET